MACTHYSIFEAVGFEPGVLCECSMHTSDPHGAMALQMLPLPHSCVCKRRLLRACTLCTGRKNTLLRGQIARFARRLFFERERKNTLLRAQKALFALVKKVGWARK